MKDAPNTEAPNAQPNTTEQKPMMLPELPACIAEILTRARTRGTDAGEVGSGVEMNSPWALARAEKYLRTEAELAVEGEGGDNQTIVVANRVFDFGVWEETALQLMLTHWNPRCSPPWDDDDLSYKVGSALKSRQEPIGRDQPTRHFDEVELPPGAEQQAPPSAGKASIAERITPLTLTDADLPGLPRRRWLAERRLIRGKVTEIVAPGGAGKSLLSLQWAIAAAFLDGKFTGLVMRERVHSLIVNLEDETDETKLRVAAVAKQFGIPFHTFSGFLHVYDDEGSGLKLLKRAPGGGLVETPAVDELIAYMLKHKIGFASFDPLVELTDAKENDNNEMAQVMSMFKRIARQTDAAILVVHHTVKPPIAASTGFAGNINASRGAGAVPNAARVGLTLFSMSEDDAKRLKVPDRQRYVRLDDGKANLYLESGKEEWFRRVSVTLPNGEEVGVLQPVELGLSQRDIEIRGMLVAFIRHRELIGEPLPTSTQGRFGAAYAFTDKHEADHPDITKEDIEGLVAGLEIESVIVRDNFKKDGKDREVWRVTGKSE